MGLLDDIKKLRERADTLNNSFKSPQGKIEEASVKLSRPQFENKFSILPISYTNMTNLY